tara:strand:- start:269 stop:1021 length:753 start_codon:yes stop_codon:yes gene_type:complete
MKIKQFAFLILITMYSHSLLSDENNKSKTSKYKNDITNNIQNKNFDEIIHVVKKGDTLSSISRKYSIKKELIIQVNKLSDENYIFIGQNLKIAEEIIPDVNKTPSYHEIKKGENLTEIANRYNLTLSKLVKINAIENQNILEIGTKLKLREEISKNQNSTIKEPSDLIPIDKPIKNKYGPLVIEYGNTNLEKRKKFLKATYKNGKKFILHLNCEKKEINVRGIGRKWKGWMPAREGFEDELLNDFCREFD